MALTHVCMWVDKSWKKISAYEAAKRFPYGTSAHSGLFMCELCGQYVVLTNGEIQSSHFRHSASEKNKDCPDRSESYSYCDFFRAEAHNLPVRLNLISSKEFSFEVGLIPLPDAMRRGASNNKILITGVEKYTYSFDRLVPGNITYLDVGMIPAEKYRICVSPSIDGIHFYWPGVIAGLDREGTLFDKETGKRLPYDADVEVGHTYYLILTGTLYRRLTAIQCTEVCVKKVFLQTWRVYEVKATRFNEEAAKFFLQFHCRLTDKPVTMYPIWPVYIESPYVIYHKSEQIEVFFQGNAELKLAPVGTITKYPYTKPRLLSVAGSDRQQLLSAGRMDVLKYMYFWECELEQKGMLPHVEVTDIKGNLLEPGIQYRIPEKQTICIVPEVDGRIMVYEDGDIVEQYRLSAGQGFELDSVRYGRQIQIYQGLDCVWDSTYKRSRQSGTDKELKILADLEGVSGKKIRVHHSLGSIVNKFKGMPAIQKWITKNVKSGYIDDKALKILQKYVYEEYR